MEERKMYVFHVIHPVHGEIELEASDRYFAVTGAAHEWGVRWSTIARDCKVEQLGCASRSRKGIPMSPSAPRNDRRKGGGKDAKADKKKQRNH